MAYNIVLYTEKESELSMLIRILTYTVVLLQIYNK